MADNNSKAYKEALQQLDNMLKKQEALKKSTESLNNSWNAIASEIFKMDGAQFFKYVEKSPEQMQEIAKEVEDLQGKFKTLGNEFSNALNNDSMFKGVKDKIGAIGLDYKNVTKTIGDLQRGLGDVYNNLSDKLQEELKHEQDIEKLLQRHDKFGKDELEQLEKIKKFQDLEKQMNEKKLDFQKKMEAELESLKASNAEISLISDDIVGKMMSEIAAGKDLGELLANATEEERKFLALLSENPKELEKISKGMSKAVAGVEKLRKEATEMNKVFSMSQTAMEALKSIGSGLGSIIKRDWVGAVTKFDEVLNQVQKDTGVNMDLNKTAFAELQTEVAQFGMNIEQAGKMMADMSKELNTTNFAVLSQATKDFAAIEGATGAAAGDITNIAGELMRMGESSGQVRDFMEGADKAARKFGVSSSKVLGAISRNIGKIRQMGFVGGEKSLTKMVATAERLRMNVDEIFDVAKRARSIEGAMDMAAELQLAGGSFANINPMDLLAAARKGPAELQKILTSMGKDIGHFSQETGKYEFDPVDVDRLQMVADATGQSLDSIQNMIQKNAEDTEKLNPFQGMIDGLDEADQEIAKSALSDMITRNKDGTLTINAESDMAKKMGVDSLEDINSDTIKAMLKAKEDDAKSLEEQNKRNQSLKQSFDNFINSLMSIFSFFQPALEVLTEIMQGVTKVFSTVMGFLPGWSKALLGGLILFGVMFGTSVGAFITQGIGGFLKGVGSFAKSTIDFVKQIATGEGGGALKGLAGKIKGKFFGGGGKDVAGEALGKGSDIANDKSMNPAAGAQKKGFLMGLAEGIKEFGKVKWGDLLKFAAAMVIIGGTIIGFGVAMATVGGDAGIGQMVTAAVSLGLLMGAVWLLSKIAGQVDMGGVLKGALAMLIVGASLIPFAFAAQMLTGVDWMSVLAGIGIIALVVIGLMVLGALMTGPQILFLLIGVGILIAVGAALMIAAAGLLLAAMAFQQLSAIDWSGFAGMGEALAAVVPGLLAFSFAAMLFMNPLALLGIMFMTMALVGLVAVMAPLAESLSVGADSLDRFASGLEKLSEAADKLSLEKLEKLKELSDSMAGASAMGAMAGAMANLANAVGGGSGGDGEVRKIEVDVKLNGRELQNFIVKDTALIK
jgi:hypothetical protein